MLGAVLTPLVGALSDYTAHRRLVGAGSAWVLAVVSVAQSMIVYDRTWFAVALLQIPSLASYVVHQGSLLSYLPGLSRIEGSAVDDERTRFRVNACVVVLAFGAQIGAVVLFFVIGVVFSLGIVDLSALVQAVVGICLLSIFSTIWHPSFMGYRGALIDVPALKVMPAHLKGVGDLRALLLVAWFEVTGSYKLLRDSYPNVLYFLSGYTISTAGMSSFATLSIVFLNDHLKLDPAETVAVVLVLLVAAVPSGAVAVRIMVKFSARTTFLATLLGMCFSTVIAPLILRDASAGPLIYVFALAWGFFFGVYYTANTSFYTQLVPKHSESQFMALFYCAAVFFNWLPPLIFTIVNQLTNGTILIFYILAFFFAVSYPLIRKVDIQQAAAEIAAHDSEHSEIVERRVSFMLTSSTRLGLSDRESSSSSSAFNNIADLEMVPAVSDTSTGRIVPFESSSKSDDGGEYFAPEPTSRGTSAVATGRYSDSSSSSFCPTIADV